MNEPPFKVIMDSTSEHAHEAVGERRPHFGTRV